MRIILNADDFGSSAETVQATVECFEQGLLTSATIMVGMPATEAALDFARRHAEHSFGAHLQFVGDGAERPVCEPALVPRLVDAEGFLLRTNEMRLRALLRRVPVEEIEREVVAQVEALQSSGVLVTHVDSHRHLHKFAPFVAALRRALPRLGITRVRNVQDVYLNPPLRSPTYWAGRVWRRSLMRSFATTEHFYMPTSAHDVEWQRLADRLPEGGTLEVGMHPGYAGWQRAELDSLRPFVSAVQEAGHELIGWSAV